MRNGRMAVLALTLGVALIGGACSKTTTTTTPAAGCTPAAKVKTLKPGTLTIGSDIPYPPFEDFGPNGTVTGFDAELMDNIAKALCLTPSWQDSHFGPIFTSLAANKFDVVASSVTAYAPKGSPAYKLVQQRAQLVNFSKPYYSSLQSLTINATKTPSIASVNDLQSGQKVGAQSATTGEFWANANLKPKGIQIVGFDKAPDMFTQLQAGSIVGVINDLPVSQAIVKKQPGLKVVQEIDTGEQYAFCTNKKNPGLLTAINAQLDKMFKDGTYAQIYKKYFPTQQLPSYASA